MSFRDVLVVACVASFSCFAVACTADTEETGTSESEIAYQCMAMPSCEPGDEPLQRGEECPDGARCYEATRCGKSLTCVEASSLPVRCLAMPVCDDGFVEVESPNDCWERSECFSRSVCGSTIWCTGPVEPYVMTTAD